jgi:hypothetical protein
VSHSDGINAPTDSTPEMPNSENREDSVTEESPAKALVETSETAEVKGVDWGELKEKLLFYGYIAELGKPFLDVNAATYEWFPDGRELFANPNAPPVWYLFSELTWNPNAVCVAVNIPFNHLFGEWDGSGISEESIGTYAGGEVSWVDSAETGGPYPYYIYCDEDIALKIYSNDDGTQLLSNQHVSLQKRSAGIEDWVLFFSERVASDKRQGGQWEKLEHYISDLGMPTDVFHSENADATPIPTEPGTENESYEIGDKGILYTFIEGKCYNIMIPAKTIFPEWDGAVVSGDTLLDRMNVHAYWSRYEGYYTYNYSFDDCRIQIDSDAFRNVLGNGVVWVQVP